MSAPSSDAEPVQAGGARAELRRERLIDAAEAVFTRDGLRGASMERIAAEAGVARATVYAYFTDKEHAFLLVSQRLAQRLETAFTAALAILAKYDLTFRVARLSPHAADLLAAKDRLAGPVFAAAEARILAALQAEMASMPVADPQEATAILFAAAKGVADTAPDVATLEQRLTRLVDAVLIGF
jgi:AcrR family transcriptional regulator